MGVIKKSFVIALIVIQLEGAAIAKTKFELMNNFMYQSGYGGNQVHDGSGNQQITLFEPTLYVDTKVGPKTSIFGSAVIDLWSSASEAIFDSGTGASGRAVASAPQRQLQNRIAFDLGVEHKIGMWTLAPNFGYSNEFDYRSIHGGLRVDKGFAQDNFVVSLGYNVFFDTTLPFDAATAAFTAWQNKRTQTVDVSASQILSPSDLILLGYEFTTQSGFLAGTQNSVDLSGTRISEVQPNSRLRHAFTLRYVHGFNDTVSAHLDYRFYLDNWGIAAHSIQPALYLGFHGDDGLAKLYYRFHTQGASNYYADSFTRRMTYMTSDSDLDALSAHEVGAMVSHKWNLKSGFLKSLNVTGAAVYYARTNNLSATVMQLGFGGEF